MNSDPFRSYLYFVFVHDKFSLKLDGIEAPVKYITTNPEKRLDVANGKNWRKTSTFRGLCDQVVNIVARCFTDIRWNER